MTFYCFGCIQQMENVMKQTYPSTVSEQVSGSQNFEMNYRDFLNDPVKLAIQHSELYIPFVLLASDQPQFSKQICDDAYTYTIRHDLKDPPTSPLRVTLIFTYDS